MNMGDMNIVDGIVLTILLVIIVFAIFKTIRRYKNGCCSDTGCGGDCKRCRSLDSENK